jgi:hypothetical protein
MTTTAQSEVATILVSCPDPTAKLLLAGAPADVSAEKVAAVEQYLYNNAPPRANLAKLRDALCTMVGLVCPEAAKKLASKVAFNYPTPRYP